MHSLLVILGTNASGKSDLGIRLALQFGGQIVSADSRQVYRGLDLGSGKITPNQAERVPHHLIDVAELPAWFTLAQFQNAAYQAIDSILSAGKLPLLVGGTGLYISAVVEGYELVDVPPNPALRAELESLTTNELANRLQLADPEAASRVDLKNPRRVIRALELAAAGRGHALARQRSPKYNCLQLGLTWPMDILEQRIATRLDDRFARGMIEEVALLRANGISDVTLDKLGLEYRYISRYLRGEICSREDLRARLLTAIRQFARAQLTWFKRDQRIIWLDPAADPFQQACRLIQKWRA